MSKLRVMLKLPTWPWYNLVVGLALSPLSSLNGSKILVRWICLDSQ